MGQDAARRRSRDGEQEDEPQQERPNISRTSSQQEETTEQYSESHPDSKRRKAPSPSLTGKPDPIDHPAARRRAVPTSSTAKDHSVSTSRRRSSAAKSHQHLQSEGTSGSSYCLSDNTGHWFPTPAEQRGNAGSDRPATSSSTQSDSALGLARLPSLSSIAQDLPVNTFPTRQSPRGPSSPNSTRSRHSISSQASSPRPSTSSSSSDTRKRRFGSRAPDGGVSRSASQVPEFRYELIIHQQPGTAAAAGLSPPALSRLPIVPSPILQLRVTGGDGIEVGHSEVLQNLPYLVCSCSLIAAEGEETPIDFANEEQPFPASTAGAAPVRRPSQPLAMMCGTRVYSLSEAKGLDNEHGIFFIFWDVSVRQEGEYRLKFSLVEALPGSPTLATVVSEPFKVVGRAEFPGTVEIATEWTRHMHRQGLTIYLPALGVLSLLRT